MIERKVSFVVKQYLTDSDWYWEWETNGEMEFVESPFRYVNPNAELDNLYYRITVKPGDYLLLLTNDYNDSSGDPEEDRGYLIQIPQDPTAFTLFAELAEKTLQDYDRILGYKQTRKGPFNYSFDFRGYWLEDYIVHIHTLEEEEHMALYTLSAALARYGQG